MDDQALLANIEYYDPPPSKAASSTDDNDKYYYAKGIARELEERYQKSLLAAAAADDDTPLPPPKPAPRCINGHLIGKFEGIDIWGPFCPRPQKDEDEKWAAAADAIRDYDRPVPESHTQYIVSQGRGPSYPSYSSSIDRQDHYAFKMTEERYKLLCEKSPVFVEYVFPPLDEKHNTQTTKRRRAMWAKLVVHMSPKQREASAANRQADIRFIATERDLENQCKLTRGLRRVVYKPPKKNELRNGTTARRQTLRRKLEAYDIHVKDCHKAKLSIKQRDTLLMRIRKKKRDTRLRSARMNKALHWYGKAKKNNKRLTLNDDYRGKPKRNRSDCPCREESHGLDTLERSFKLFNNYGDSNNNTSRHFRWTAEESLAHDDVAEERTDNLLLGWGVCKECVSKYKDDLVTLTLWLKRSWPHNLNVYCGILEGVRSQGLAHDMIVKAMNRDIY